MLYGLLKAVMDAMVDSYKKQEEQLQAKGISASGEEEHNVEMPVPPAWSLFKYLATPKQVEFENEEDGNIYFTIPCGYEVDDTLRYWFVRFSLGSVDEVRDYYIDLDTSLIQM